jgi:hypothetical protein
MIHLVTTGECEGRVERVPGDPKGYTLHVTPYVVRFEVDRERAIVRVYAVYVVR